jgi:hypothetical protein
VGRGPRFGFFFSGLLWLAKSVAVESACLLTALVVILRDLRDDCACVPYLEGIPACGLYTALRSNHSLSSGRDPGLGRNAAPHVRVYWVFGTRPVLRQTLTIKPSPVGINGLGSLVSNERLQSLHSHVCILS